MINSERDGHWEDLYTSLDIVHHWSQHRNPSNINRKYFHEIPILGTKEWKNAYFWVEYKEWVLKKEILMAIFNCFLLNHRLILQNFS